MRRHYSILLLFVLACVSLAGAQGRSRQGEQRDRGRERNEARRGDWLRNHQHLPPEQQERELQKDPGFRTLPPQGQERLRQQLRNFNNMPAEQRQLMLHRMERWDQFSPKQKDRARDLINRFQSLPSERQQLLRKTARGIGNVGTQDRERALDSTAARDGLNENERDTLRDMLDLGIVPGVQK